MVTVLAYLPALVPTFVRVESGWGPGAQLGPGSWPRWAVELQAQPGWTARASSSYFSSGRSAVSEEDELQLREQRTGWSFADAVPGSLSLVGGWGVLWVLLVLVSLVRLIHLCTVLSA